MLRRGLAWCGTSFSPNLLMLIMQINIEFSFVLLLCDS